jgi:hypothetical protein
MIRLLVTEKETRIKEGMKMMGLSDTVYHISWFIIMVSRRTLLQWTRRSQHSFDCITYF